MTDPATRQQLIEAIRILASLVTWMPTDDPDITCMVCGQPGCDIETTTLRHGMRSWHGAHAACAGVRMIPAPPARSGGRRVTEGTIAQRVLAAMRHGTTWSAGDLSTALPDISIDVIRVSLSKHIQTGKVLRVERGVYRLAESDEVPG